MSPMCVACVHVSVCMRWCVCVCVCARACLHVYMCVCARVSSCGGQDCAPHDMFTMVHRICDGACLLACVLACLRAWLCMRLRVRVPVCVRVRACACVRASLRWCCVTTRRTSHVQHRALKLSLSRERLCSVRACVHLCGLCVWLVWCLFVCACVDLGWRVCGRVCVCPTRTYTQPTHGKHQHTFTCTLAHQHTHPTRTHTRKHARCHCSCRHRVHHHRLKVEYVCVPGPSAGLCPPPPRGGCLCVDACSVRV